METVDDEFTDRRAWIDGSRPKVEQAVLLLLQRTRMHVFTHLKKESEGKTGLGLYPDGMVEHDGHVGQLLKKLDDLGIAENTIVVYTTDNGAEVMTWPDGGTTPLTWRKGDRLGRRVSRADVHPLARSDQARHGNQRHLFAHEDLIPTFAAAAGELDLSAR